MKQLRFHETGLPSEVLKLEEVPKPSPGEGEALIKVSLCNMIPADMMFIQGQYGLRPQLPAAGGFEAVGVVEEAGAGVVLPKGVRVSFTALGVWQEYVVAPAKTLIPVPDLIPDEVACQAFVNPLTAYGMLDMAAVQEGQWLLLTAGNSAFSRFVIQLCKERGIHTICTVRSDEQIQPLLDLGASHVINVKKDDLAKTVYKLTEKKGVNACFEAVGGETGEAALNSLGMGGIMLVYGLLSLKNPAFNQGLMIFKDITVKGFWLTNWLNGLSGKEMQERVTEVISKLASNELQASVQDTYPLDGFQQAIKAFDTPGRQGKILLRP